MTACLEMFPRWHHQNIVCVCVCVHVCVCVCVVVCVCMCVCLAFSSLFLTLGWNVFFLPVFDAYPCPCLVACDSNQWGSDCGQLCKCENGGLCDPVSGTCQCPAGFIGRSCKDPCPTGTFGKGCLQKCQCGTGGSCDKMAGECICRSGFTGTLWVDAPDILGFLIYFTWMEV